jgi:kinesin family member C2/C3
MRRRRDRRPRNVRQKKSRWEQESIIKIQRVYYYFQVNNPFLVVSIYYTSIITFNFCLDIYIVPVLFALFLSSIQSTIYCIFLTLYSLVVMLSASVLHEPNSIPTAAGTTTAVLGEHNDIANPMPQSTLGDKQFIKPIASQAHTPGPAGPAAPASENVDVLTESQAQSQSQSQSQNEMNSHLFGAAADKVAILTTALERSNKNLESSHTALRHVLSRERQLKCMYESQISELTDLLAEQQDETETHAQKQSELEANNDSLKTQIKQLNHTVKNELQTKMIDLRNSTKSMAVEFGRAMQQAQESFDSQLNKAMSNAFEEIESLKRQLTAERALREDIETKYRDTAAVRRKLHNQVQKLRGNIRVFCRVRPLLSKEQKLQSTMRAIAEPAANTVSMMHPGHGRQSTFEYEKVFGPNSSQADVYNNVDELVTSVLDGFNVCIFAYGQTGSGKTHTMEGNRKQRGVNYRALARMFELSTDTTEYERELSVSMMEIYNENICDLLERKQVPFGTPGKGTSSGYDIRMGKSGVFVKGLSRMTVTSHEQVTGVVAQGLAARSMSATNVHDRSSRSHCILTVYVTSTHTKTGNRYIGKLNLVDLAGSENVKNSDAQGQQLREAQHINKSLSALGDVFLALANKNKHVPYRNSKLTHVLSDSLGGDSKTLMICCLNPTNHSESTNTLNFASRARTVCIGPATPNKKRNRVALRQNLH